MDSSSNHALDDGHDRFKKTALCKKQCQQCKLQRQPAHTRQTTNNKTAIKKKRKSDACMTKLFETALEARKTTKHILKNGPKLK